MAPVSLIGSGENDLRQNRFLGRAAFLKGIELGFLGFKYNPAAAAMSDAAQEIRALRKYLSSKG
ncbi:MAG TPA: hypothetical protein VIY49_39145 [Bryobacteraceae bacterium]